MPMAQRVYPNDETRLPAYPEPGEGFPPEEPRYHPNLAPVGRAVRPSSPALNNAAEKVGGAVGSAVGRVKQLPDRMQEMKERFRVIRGRGRENLKTRATDLAEDFKDQAQRAANRARVRATDLAEDLKDQAQRTATQARARAERLAHEQPLVVILGSAVAGMVLGIALRIWRDHAD